MSLVPLSEKDIHAEYVANTKTLEVIAKGEFPAIVVGIFFQRDLFAGGIKLSLVGYYGGIPGGPHELEATFTEHISLPVPHFNNKTIIVETKDGTYEIPIHYSGFGPSPVNGNTIPVPLSALKDNKDNTITTVLPPIPILLPGGKTATVKARVPEKLPLNSVNTKFNETFIRVLNAGFSDGQIWWTFKWEKLPLGEGENPQLFEVVTESFNGVMPPDAKRYIIIQGYIVRFGVLEKN